MKLSAAIVTLVLAAGSAHAAPLDLAIDAKDLTAAVPGLFEQHDEPVGLVATSDNATLGLVKGDLVRAINGQSATRMSMLTDGGTIMYLDVMRGTQPLVVRLAVKLADAENVIPRDQYKDRVQQLQRFGPDLISDMNHVFTQVTKSGAPSGVMIRSLWFGFGTLIEGDVIRKIDGVEVATTAQAVEAFARAKDHHEIAITVERLDQIVVKTLRIDDSLIPDPTIATAAGNSLTASVDAVGDDEMASCTRHAQPKIALSLGGQLPTRSIGRKTQIIWNLE